MSTATASPTVSWSGWSSRTCRNDFKNRPVKSTAGSFLPLLSGCVRSGIRRTVTAELITDTDPETGNSRNAFYSDINGEKHWFEINLPPELMEQVHGVCRKEAALALESYGAQNLDKRFTLPPGPVM